MNKSETAGGGPLLAEDYRKARKEVSDIVIAPFDENKAKVGHTGRLLLFFQCAVHGICPCFSPIQHCRGNRLAVRLER